MPGRYRSRIVPPAMTLGERVARDKGVYPEANSGWNIDFKIFYKGKWILGHMLANQLRLMIGMPGSFLVFWDARFQGILSWAADGWLMPMCNDMDLIAMLGEWIEIYYQ